MEKQRQEKIKSGTMPAEAEDWICSLKNIAGRLKVLYAAGQKTSCDYYETSGFQDITLLILESGIKELNTIIPAMEKATEEES